jgi:metallo-beta-lactamase class B
MNDIKVMLATHAHYDHVAGFAEIKKLTGAKIMINENDAPVLADGGQSDYVFGSKGPTFAPVKADVLLHEHDTIKFGGMKIIALHTPGHTKGATSFLFDVKDDNRTYKVLIANMPTVLDDTKLSGMPTYPDVAKKYAYTFDLMKSLQFDLFLASHAAQFKMHSKRKPGDAYNPEVFMDRKGYDASLNNLYQLYQRKLQANF